MGTTSRCLLLAVLPVLTIGAGCVPASTIDTDPGASTSAADTSREIDFYTIKVSSAAVGESATDSLELVRRQLLYTVGILNGSNSSANIGGAHVTIESEATLSETSKEVHYATELRIAWPRENKVPAAFEFKLPRDVSVAGLQAFASRYRARCADLHDNPGEPRFFYFYRPYNKRCIIDAGDVVTFASPPSAKEKQSEGTYPEYDRVWADGELRVVAVFGRNEPGVDRSGFSLDAGAQALSDFTASANKLLKGAAPTFAKSTLPNPGGSTVHRFSWTATLDATHKLTMLAYLVDKPQAGGAAFEAELARESQAADFLAYAGHAGLGVNIEAFLARITTAPAQYRVLLLENCNSYAYQDLELLRNPPSLTGESGDQDVIVNAMSGYFSEIDDMMTRWLDALMHPATPRPFLEILPARSQGRAMVLFDEDNAYHP